MALDKESMKTYTWMIAAIVGVLVIVTSVAIPLGFKLYDMLLSSSSKAKVRADQAVKAAQEATVAAAESQNAASQAVESFRRTRR